jgi:hypothetical protein
MARFSADGIETAWRRRMLFPAAVLEAMVPMIGFRAWITAGARED